MMTQNNATTASANPEGSGQNNQGQGQGGQSTFSEIVPTGRQMNNQGTIPALPSIQPLGYDMSNFTSTAPPRQPVIPTVMIPNSDRTSPGIPMKFN